MAQARETPQRDPADNDLTQLLESARTIAVVGLSPEPARPSHGVAAYLKDHGYTILPVNPNVTHVLGERSYPSVRDLPAPVDIVNIFRRPNAVPEIVNDAITRGARAVWMQLGVIHEPAAQTARTAGIQVIMNRCIMVDHHQLGIDERKQSARDMFDQAARLLNPNRQEYLDRMLQVLERAKREGDRFTVANALMECGRWMSNAGRLREALSFYELRLAPDVWHEDKLEIQCVHEMIREIRSELESAG